MLGEPQRTSSGTTACSHFVRILDVMDVASINSLQDPTQDPHIFVSGALDLPTQRLLPRDRQERLVVVKNMILLSCGRSPLESVSFLLTVRKFTILLLEEENWISVGP